METYARWRNAGPRDQKINDREMLRWMLLLLQAPFVSVLVALRCWNFIYPAGSIALYARILFVYAPRDVSARVRHEWVRITEFPDR